jgi:hypothetical protein
VCESNGESPIANILQPSVQNGEPIAIEGEVCCGQEELQEADQDQQEDLPELMEDDHRAEVTRQECLDRNGTIVGDIGNGAIFNDDYVCESSGESPVANILQPSVESGESIAIEGEVCCGQEELQEADQDQQEDLPEEMEDDRAEVTRQECLDRNGTIVGDIGNGAIFNDDYVCESSGESPIANILQPSVESGEPIAIEGEVCCGQEELQDADQDQQEDLPEEMEDDHAEVTRQECIEELGGEIVGDIGDGVSQQDDYICESSGEGPLANIVPAEGEPLPFEGEVCCGPAPLVDELEDAAAGVKMTSSLYVISVAIMALLWTVKM